MAEVWNRKGSAPIVGQDRQAHYLFIPHHCRITARWVGRGVVARLVWWRWFSTQYEAETFVFSRIYCNIRKPLMPIRYPIAFRGTARPSVCSAWRLKVPILGAFPKPFAYFSLICSFRNPRFSWNLERLRISVKPRLAFVISETCKPFSSLSAFSPFSATKAVLRV